MKKIRKKGRRKSDIRQESWMFLGREIRATVARRAGESEDLFLARWEAELGRKRDICPPDTTASTEDPSGPSVDGVDGVDGAERGDSGES